MTSHPSTLVENGLDEITPPHQLFFAFAVDPGVHFPPLVGDDDDISKGSYATELSEHVEVPLQYPGHLGVGDSVEVKDARERFPLLVPTDEEKT